MFRRILPGGKAGYFLIPPIGGRETRILECDFGAGYGPKPYADWLPDSKRLILSSKGSPNEPWGLFLFSLETRESTRLTSPKLLNGDGAPAISPDGRSLLFVRDVGTVWTLYLQSLSGRGIPEGEPRKVDQTKPESLYGAWTADGREIVYCAPEYHATLWRIAASGSARPRRLVWAGEEVYGAVISRQKNRLVFGRKIWHERLRRLDIAESPGETRPPVEVTATPRRDYNAAYSPDGKRIAFQSDRSGRTELWLCESDGSNPVKLTSLHAGAPQWSPDGEWIAFYARTPEGILALYRIRASGGAPQRLTPPGSPADNPSWSADGKWIYFQSDRSGQVQIWKMPSGGGEAVQVTRAFGSIPRASPDGRFVYFAGPAGPGSRIATGSTALLEGEAISGGLWRIPVLGGKEEKILDSVWDFDYAPVREGVYFTQTPGEDGRFFLKFYDLATKKIRPVAEFDGPPGWVISVSPDQRSILYSRYELVSKDLMLVENFR